MNNKIVTIFGGSGFIARYLVKYLAQEGFIIKITTRDPEKAAHLKTYAPPGIINIFYIDIYDQQSLQNIIKNSYCVINLVASFAEKDKNEFTYLHSQFPEKIAKIAMQYEVRKFIHFSNLNIENISTIYANSRLLGEKAVRATFPKSIIIKPSVIIAPDDSFLNILYLLAKKFRFLPLAGQGNNFLQPVYAGDVAKSVVFLLNEIEDNAGIYKIAGREIFSLKEIDKKITKILDRKIFIIEINAKILEFIAKILSWQIMNIFYKILLGMNSSPISPEQIRLSQYDNILQKNDENLIDRASIKATSLETILEKIHNNNQ